MKRLILILIVLTSCGTPHRMLVSEPPHFFACSRWTDLNHDGKYDYNEFENIKDTFHSPEQILFVGFLVYPSGTSIKFKLYSPDGNLIHEVEQIQIYSKTLLHSEYRVADLISGRPEGEWEGVWEADGEEIADIRVNLLR